jgi:hypothetical protein
LETSAPVEFINRGLVLLFGPLALVEQVGGPFDQLALPAGDHGWMNFKPGGKLRGGHFIFQGGESHFCLEL